MGPVSLRKILTLCLLLGLASWVVYWRPSSPESEPGPPLSQALEGIPGWENPVSLETDPRILGALSVDEYVNQVYSRGRARIYLFIGYYGTSRKIGAPHSPLVCYPGQGWTVSESESLSVRVRGEDLHLASMVVGKESSQHLVLYWFQAYDRTSPGSFLQKVYLLKAKLFQKREENAFVRVSIPMDGWTQEEAFQTCVEFIRDFYPLFLDRIRGRGARERAEEGPSV